MTTVAEAVEELTSRMMARRKKILGDLPPLGFKPVDNTTTFEHGVRYLLLVQRLKLPPEGSKGDMLHSEIIMFHPHAGNDFDLEDFPDGIITESDVRDGLEIGPGSTITGFMKEQDLLDLFTAAPKNRILSPRLTMLVKVSNDLDAMPGWGYVASDWVNMLANGSFMNQSHYNTTFEVVGADVT